uniref:Uncharacterized protein n=1 Tax=Meloidogyne enterolobii TaxID=390850 RepID=A0A6V7WQ26_MELEN|nr:unnamed protein product [Meloidogyne enterolobii]
MIWKTRLYPHLTPSWDQYTSDLMNYLMILGTHLYPRSRQTGEFFFGIKKLHPTGNFLGISMA